MKLQVRCHLPLWNPALLKSRQDLASPGIRTNEKKRRREENDRSGGEWLRKV